MLIRDTKLLFISNELLCKDKQQQLHIPLEFVTFAHIKGKMYKHYFNDGTFVLTQGKRWGNDVVYGAIFALRDFNFYIRLIDSYHQCSNSLLGRNHSKDIHHRHVVNATTIHFDTLDELDRLKYRERSEIEVLTYYGNINHPKINQRLNKTASYRMLNGVNPCLIKLFREVTV